MESATYEEMPPGVVIKRAGMRARCLEKEERSAFNGERVAIESERLYVEGIIEVYTALQNGIRVNRIPKLRTERNTDLSVRRKVVTSWIFELRKLRHKTRKRKSPA